MASASTKSLPIHIVEDHNEALEHIYRAIGSKKLPYTGICLLHLDAHPDLLSPDLPADLVYEKETLYETISISDWILPAVYAGHFNSIVWLKPPWSMQMTDGCYQLTVGRHRENGMIRSMIGMLLAVLILITTTQNIIVYYIVELYGVMSVYLFNQH